MADALDTATLERLASHFPAGALDKRAGEQANSPRDQLGGASGEAEPARAGNPRNPGGSLRVGPGQVSGSRGGHQGSAAVSERFKGYLWAMVGLTIGSIAYYVVFPPV